MPALRSFGEGGSAVEWVECGMIGVNIGIPAPVAPLPFGGMKNSLFSDIKAQGKAVIDFFTEDKIITERYWPE